MSKCDTMRPGDVLRLRNRETEEEITVQIRSIDWQRREVRVLTDADLRWKICKLGGRQERESD